MTMVLGTRARSALAAVVVAAALTLPIATAPAAGAAPPQALPAAVEGELLVRFEARTPGSERAAVRARNGLQKVRDLPLAGVELVRFDPSAHPRAKADRMRLERSVAWAEPNQLWHPAIHTTPDDPRFVEQWALHNTGQTLGTIGADIGALDAWHVAADTSDVVVAVLDTGIDISHPDLAGQVWTNTAELAGAPGVDDDGNGYIDDVHGWDFFNNDASVYDAVDGDSHGTHVAGTIAATTGNGAGIAGVSSAKLMPLKFLGPDGGTTADAVEALDYAMAMGAHITNNSWGSLGSSAALAQKIAEAEAAGLLVVAAAGNGGEDKVGDDNDALPSYPASYTNANVVSVAATDDDDGLASFSNHGATSVDLGAPGVRILSTVPGGYGLASGTSMAAPHVTGGLVHLLAAYPHLTGLEAKDLLLERATPVASLAGKTVSGGRMDLAAALGVGVAPPQLSIADADFVEGGVGDQTVMEIPVTLSAPHPRPVTVAWATGGPDDTATADADYTPVVDGTLTLEPGQTEATLPVVVTDDAELELDETLTVTLSSPTEATIATGSATGTIISDDRPVVSIVGPSAGAGEADGTARFTVSLSEPSPWPAQVDFATVDGTAMAGSDYTAASGTLTFDGTTTQTIDVTIIDDTVDEADETFTVALRNPVDADLGIASAGATIVDDDVAPPPTGGGGSTGGGGGSTGGTTGGTTPTTSGEPATETTDPEGATPTPSNPLVVTVSAPAGPISVTENDGADVSGYAGLGVGVAIEAPDAPADDPLRLRFDLHVPADVPADAIVVARNGVAITSSCADPGVAAPDPCEASRTRSGDVLTVVINSTRASQWDLVVPSVLRIAGDDRISTAVAVSEATWGARQARAVVLARADSFPDALAGGALATARGGPLMLTSSTGLPDAVSTEIRRVLPAGGTVHVLGGTAAIASTVDDQLRGMGFAVERTAGADRFATATAIAGKADTSPAAVLVTTGSDFPDALAASAAAGHIGGVVVLTDGPRLPAATQAYLAGMSDTPVYAVGGPAAAALAGTVPGATTLAGADRYATSALVAQRFFDQATMVGIATGQSFPDALAAGARLGRAGAPLLLSPQPGLTATVAERIGSAARVELYGGPGALSTDVEREAGDLVG